MELQFESEICRCLRQPVREIRRQEACQEVRLPEELPDVGHVVAAWGQMILRGKQWLGNAMQASLGIMAWILYEPEDGTACRRVEAWVPIQMKWEVPQTQREGIMCFQGGLCQLDARALSPRKLSVRAEAAVLGQAFEPMEAAVRKPAALPEGVELLTNTYPVTLMQEAGEKTVSIEEVLTLPASQPELAGVVRWELLPRIAEQKVLGGKLMFRGMAELHLLYETREGRLETWDAELPFSQLAELEDTFSQEAWAQVIPVTTNLELEKTDQGLELRCGLVGQYQIFDRVELELPEDAYSPVQETQAHEITVELPRLLDSFRQTLPLEAEGTLAGERVVDVSMLPQPPRLLRTGDQLEGEISAGILLLLESETGSLESRRTECSYTMKAGADASTSPELRLLPPGRPQIRTGSGSWKLQAEAEAQLQTFTDAAVSMLGSITVGQRLQLKADRPALVLRRFEEESLWTLAKRCGSTVESIRRINHLEQEPISGQMLLIPVV